MANRVVFKPFEKGSRHGEYTIIEILHDMRKGKVTGASYNLVSESDSKTVLTMSHSEVVGLSADVWDLLGKLPKYVLFQATKLVVDKKTAVEIANQAKKILADLKQTRAQERTPTATATAAGTAADTTASGQPVKDNG